MENDSSGKIYAAIAAVMREINAVGKNKQNKQQGFMYRGVDDVMNVLNPALAKHNVFIAPEILEQKREERRTAKGTVIIYSICKIRYRFFADDGSYIDAVTIGEGMDTGDKSTNKAMSIAFKYACFQVFCIPTEDMADPDEETPEKIKKENNEKIDEIKINTIRKEIMKKGLSEKSILDYYKLGRFEEMEINVWMEAMRLLDKYKDMETTNNGRN